MRTQLRTQQGQHFVMTSQILQSIRLLQLDAVTLEQEISAALATNPLLERIDQAECHEADTLAGCIAPEVLSQSAVEAHPAARDYDEDDRRHQRITSNAASTATDWDALASITPQPAIDVRSAIRQQLSFARLSSADLALASWLLDETDEAGYLIESIESLRERLPKGLDGSSLEQIRLLILHAEPAGLCALSLAECLVAQLQVLDAAPVRNTALVMAGGYLPLLADHSIEDVASVMAVDIDLAQAAFRLLLSLDPKPAICVPEYNTIVVIPEVYAFRRDGIWSVELNPLSAPQIRVDPEIERMIETLSGDPRANRVRDLMHQARWLTRGLAMRYDTLLRVASVIVRRQSAFLERGSEAMTPLTLREVAEELHIHESTVSRVAAGKYIQTPRGTFELRKFFSVRVAGAVIGNVAIQAMVKRLIEQENPISPLADDKIVTLLARQGVQIARRTVAKYRDLMHIAPARLRQCTSVPSHIRVVAS
jgi:RNA polymerase sigma-54 factor